MNYNNLMDERELLLKLGAKIRYERVKRKLSQEQLAELANLNMRSISTIECGIADVKFTTLYKLAKAFDMDIKSLVEILF
jgi:transcriptional regulator with XRE-family HTH domain